MTPQRWQRVHDVFDAACDVAPESRGQFVALHCGGDEELQREVETLLQFDLHETPTLKNPTLPSMARLPDPADVRAEEAAESIAAQRRLGAYELLRPLATGGMSMVWLAQRADDHFKQLVAVKVIKRGLEGPDVLTRFRNERQLLANLSHPNIARLLDGGVTDEGLPYLVMEFVDGKPIDRYCDERSLSIPRRLELFRTVCAAVAYAHQSLIVHRDLKPANILVTSRGVPLLLDFGIAKVLNPTDRPGFDTVTLLGERPMTPAYASPEQIRGRPITTASDVYSLGVVLYELLCGHRPYESSDGRPIDYLNSVCETPPPRPSSVVNRPVIRSGDSAASAISPQQISARRESDPSRLRQRLAGDLDTIVLKAMEKDPGRRYASVEQLAEDIRRHLSGLPVRARPATIGYQTAKFVKRNVLSIIALSTVVMVVSVLVFVLWQQARALTRERDHARLSEIRAQNAFDDAQAEARRARKSIELLLDSLAALAAAPEADVSHVLELFDETARQFDAQPLNDARLEAEHRLTLGRGYLRVNRAAQAEQQFVRAVELCRAAGESSMADLAEASFELGAVRERLGNWSAAEEALARGLDAERRAMGYRHASTAAGACALGELLLDLQRYEDAQEVLGELFAEPNRLEGFSASDIARGRLAYARVLLPSNPDAGRIILESVIADERQRSLDASSVAMAEAYLAESLARLGDSARAAQRVEDAVQALQSAAGDSRRFARALAIQSRVYQFAGALERGERAARESLAVLASLGLRDHPSAGEPLSLLGECLAGRGELGSAEDSLREAEALQVRAAGERTPLVSLTRFTLGDVLTRAGRANEATRMLRDAAANYRREISGPDRSLALALDATARAYEAVGDIATAAAMLDELEVVLVELEGAGSPAVQAVRERVRGLRAMK